MLLAWIAGAVVLAASGALASNELLMPALTGIPVAGFVLAYRWNPAFRETVLSPDSGLLVILHGWRMLGLGSLLLYAHDICRDCLPDWPVRGTRWSLSAPH